MAGLHPVPSEIAKLDARFQQDFPDHLLTPCMPGKKQPVYKFQGTSYTRELWNFVKDMQAWEEWGLLIRHPAHLPEGAPAIMVVDCDTPEAVAHMESLHPSCKTTVSVHTRKGKHFYFCPTPESHALSTFASTIREIPHYAVDLKFGYLSTPTPSVAIIPPSTNKTWERSFEDAVMEDLPDEVLEFLTMLYTSHSNEKELITTGPQDKRGTKVCMDVLLRLLQGLPAPFYKHGHGYERWRNVVWGIRNVARNSGYGETARDIAEAFSAQDGEYANTRMINVLMLEESRVGWTTLKNYLKQCNPDLWHEMFAPPPQAPVMEEYAFLDEEKEEEAPTPMPSPAAAPVIVDDLLAARTLLGLIGEDRCFRVNGSLYFFNAATGMFEEDDKDHAIFQGLASSFQEQLLLEGVDVKGKPTTVNYGGSARLTCAMRQKFLAAAPKKDDLFTNGLDSSKGKLLFTNGMLDMATGEFTTTFDPKVIFKDSVGRAFVPREHVENLIPTWREKLFGEAFEAVDGAPAHEGSAVSNHLIKMLGRGLAGEYMDKKAAMILGRTNSCKGTITDAVTAAAGGYVGNFNMTSMCSGTFVNPDVKSLSFIVQFCFKRLAFGNEAPDTDAISGFLLRSTISGGDQITVRTNRVDEYSVRQRAMLVMMANDMPRINPYTETEANRLDFFQCTSQWVPAPDPAKPFQKLADPEIKTVLKTHVDVRNAVLWVLIDGYQASLRDGMEVPRLCLEAKKEWTQSLTIQDHLEAGGYRITLDHDDEEPFSALFEYITKTESGPKLKLSATAFGKQLKDLQLVPAVRGQSQSRQRYYTGISYTPSYNS